MISHLLTERYLKQKNRDSVYDAGELPDYDEIKENKRSFAQSFYKQYCNTDPFSGKRLFEPLRWNHICCAESTGKAIDTDGNG